METKLGEEKAYKSGLTAIIKAGMSGKLKEAYLDQIKLSPLLATIRQGLAEENHAQPDGTPYTTELLEKLSTVKLVEEFGRFYESRVDRIKTECQVVESALEAQLKQAKDELHDARNNASRWENRNAVNCQKLGSVKASYIQLVDGLKEIALREHEAYKASAAAAGLKTISGQTVEIKNYFNSVGGALEYTKGIIEMSEAVIKDLDAAKNRLKTEIVQDASSSSIDLEQLMSEEQLNESSAELQRISNSTVRWIDLAFKGDVETTQKNPTTYTPAGAERGIFGGLKDAMLSVSNLFNGGKEVTLTRDAYDRMKGSVDEARQIVARILREQHGIKLERDTYQQAVQREAERENAIVNEGKAFLEKRDTTDSTIQGIRNYESMLQKVANKVRNLENTLISVKASNKSIEAERGIVTEQLIDYIKKCDALGKEVKNYESTIVPENKELKDRLGKLSPMYVAKVDENMTLARGLSAEKQKSSSLEAKLGLVQSQPVVRAFERQYSRNVTAAHSVSKARELAHKAVYLVSHSKMTPEQGLQVLNALTDLKGEGFLHRIHDSATLIIERWDPSKLSFKKLIKKLNVAKGRDHLAVAQEILV